MLFPQISVTKIEIDIFKHIFFAYFGSMKMITRQRQCYFLSVCLFWVIFNIKDSTISSISSKYTLWLFGS